MLITLFYTEIKLLLRHSQEWLYPLGFFFIVVSLFPFAFNPDANFLKNYAPGCIWIAVLLANLLSIQYLFFIEMEEGSLEQLLLNQHFLLCITAKLTAHWLLFTIPLLLFVPLFGWFFHLHFTTILILCFSLLLGSPLLTLIGSFGAALTLGLKQQGVLIGLLILPLVIPVLIFGVTIVQQFQSGLSVLGPCAFLSGLSLLAIALMPSVIGLTLRLGMDE
jgi:heme exporter protein B